MGAKLTAHLHAGCIAGDLESLLGQVLFEIVAEGPGPTGRLVLLLHQALLLLHIHLLSRMPFIE